MQTLSDPTLEPIFQPDAASGGNIRALVVAGACGNVGLGKLGQFARLLVPKGILVFALDLSSDVLTVHEKLRKGYGDRFDPKEIDAILAGVRPVRGTVADLPADVRIGFVFEAIPERLDIKHAFYAAIRQRDPEAYIFSATSGFPSTTLFGTLPGSERCGVLHPFFPHLTNKLWEMPQRDATTGKAESKIIRSFLGALGMNLVPVRDVPAFAADRLFCGMMLEAVRIHDELGLSPAQVDDVCKKTFGTSPFFVHNLIAGANYLSAHCMELLQGEVDSTLYAIPEVWKPYLGDPKKQWPYEKGQSCPPAQFEQAHDRMLGMLLSLTAYMIEHEVVSLDALNFLCENALAFREGTPALVERIGYDQARSLVEKFVREQKVTQADLVAPAHVFDAKRPGWGSVYVHTQVLDGVGLLSLKRTTINDTFLRELDAAYTTLQADPAVKAIVIAPDGQYSREFGHGADLGAFVPVLGNEGAALALIQRWKQTLVKLRSGKPTVAALVGRVLGGGLELAAACHARIAAKGTRLAFPETTVGVIPGLGGCHHVHRFSQATAYDRINEVLLTGHGFGADEAATWGFVSAVVPVKDLPKESMAFAARLAAGTQPMPTFRDAPADVAVRRDVATTNEQGVTLDAKLRDLLARTITDTNALPYADASRLEEARAAESLAMSSSKIGVTAAQRGKPPQFDTPL